MAKVVYPAGDQAAVGEYLLPRKVNFVLYRGDDFDVDATLSQRDGQPIILTGWTVHSQAKKGTQVIAIDARISSDGKFFTLSISSSSLQQMIGIYEYDVEFTQPNGKKKTFMFGTINVLKDVTN